MRRLRREATRYRSAVPKLLTIGWQDWVALFKAQVALLRAQRELRRRPTGEFVSETDVDAVSTENRIEEVRRLALAMRRAATFGVFRPACLAKSIGLRQLLADAGISGANVRVGVRVIEGRFIAHAWVEYNGEVVGDDPAEVAAYQRLSGIQVAEFR